jgi:hypothetical protein
MESHPSRSPMVVEEQGSVEFGLILEFSVAEPASSVKLEILYKAEENYLKLSRLESLTFRARWIKRPLSPTEAMDGCALPASFG